MIAPCPFTWDEWASASLVILTLLEILVQAGVQQQTRAEQTSSRPTQYNLANKL